MPQVTPFRVASIGRASCAPTVSVVMAVYRPHADYFVQAVQSVLSQTVRDLELVIVEDPSATAASDLLAAVPDPRVRHFRNARRTSLVAQRNRCLAEAHSDLVAILDADDVAEPDRLERQLDFLRRRPEVDVVGSQLAVVDAGGKHLGYRTYPLDHADIVRSLRRHSPFAQNTVLFRKPAVLAAGGYQYSYNNTVEDYDLWSRLALRGARLANVPEPLVRYRLHPGQMKATQLRDTIKGVVAVKMRYWHGQMSVAERLRLWAEGLLPRLPSAWVLRWLVRWRWLRHDPRLLRPAGGAGESLPLPALHLATVDGVE